MNLSKMILFTGIFSFFSFAQAASFEYTTVDLNKCSTISQGEGGRTSLCPGVQGPLGPIQIEVLSGDNENINIIHAGRKHQTWNYIADVGHFTFIGGKNRVIEWVKDNQKNLRALIFRVEAQSNNASKLIVLGVTKYEICYFGTVQTNQQARTLGETGFCGDYLPSVTAQ